jgi:predicted DNA-binding antitoxin AbrB/MazE fold protein
MPHTDPIRAIYENGILKLLQPLPLRNSQRVKVLVFPDDPQRSADPDRVRQWHEQTNDWLARQPAHAVREPRPLSSAEREHLDAEFDMLLAEIRRKSGSCSEMELATLVDAAVAAVREGDA